MGSTGQSPKMRSGESPATTRRHLQSVAVEKATTPEANFKANT